MKIVYIGIMKNEGGGENKAIELSAARDVSSYNRWYRDSLAELITEFAMTAAGKTKPGQKLDITNKEKDPDYIIHAYGHTEGICGIIVTDLDYPSRVAHDLLKKVCDEFVTKYPRSAYANVTKESVKSTTFPFPELKEYITKYQDPEQADNILKIQKELDETKGVIVKTLDSLLERGQKMDDLVAKSDGLSAQSKMFYTQAKKQNSCCIVM